MALPATRDRLLCRKREDCEVVGPSGRGPFPPPSVVSLSPHRRHPSPREPQDAPPAPLSDDVFVDFAPAAEYYVLSYGGHANEQKIVARATELTDLLDKEGLTYDFSSFFAAGYDSPFRLINRHNEVWIKAE